MLTVSELRVLTAEMAGDAEVVVYQDDKPLVIYKGERIELVGLADMDQEELRMLVDWEPEKPKPQTVYVVLYEPSYNGGTQTWGAYSTEAEAARQMNRAMECSVLRKAWWVPLEVDRNVVQPEKPARPAIVAGEELDRAVCEAVNWENYKGRATISRRQEYPVLPSRDIGDAMGCLAATGIRTIRLWPATDDERTWICHLGNRADQVESGAQPTKCLAICKAILLAKEAGMLETKPKENP